MEPREKLVGFLIVVIAIVCSGYVIKTRLQGEPCAESCSCTGEDTDLGYAVNVQCDRRNLTSLPITSHDKPVSVLKVSLNVPNTLEEDALLSYQSVRYLYLQHCRIVNINEKAFQKLENLTVIDLSSNHLTSIHPNLFSGNQHLDKLILRSNDLSALQLNTPILNGPPSLSSLDLQSCKLSNISSITFSLLPNLTFIDISRNKLTLLHIDTLSSRQKLKDVILENNPWQCGAVFKELMCWMHIKLAHSNTRTVQCQYKNKTWEKWSAENRSSLCDSDLTRSDTPSHKPDIPTSTTLNPERTPSHELDILTSTTVNTEAPLQEDPVTTSSSLLFWVLFVLCAILLLLLPIVFFISRKLFGGKYGAVQNESEETSTLTSPPSSAGGGEGLLNENMTHERHEEEKKV